MEVSRPGIGRVFFLTSVTLFPAASVKKVIKYPEFVGSVVVAAYEQIKIICQMSRGFFFLTHTRTAS